jgi:EmrB/QacA subfamily drug resistance transporter
MTTAPNKWSVIALVCVGMFMTTLDASIVNIGLPAIARAFGTPLNGTIEWVIIGYLLVIAALLLTVGRLSDMVGRTPIWTAGLAIFTLGSVVCGAAPSLRLLIAARALQGIGAALILAVSTAILIESVPPTERGHALGWSAGAVAIGFSAGPTLGGLLTEYLSWRWIFYVNVPIGVGAIIATRRILPRTAGGQRGRFDPAGALLLGIGLAAINLGLSFGVEWGWTSFGVLGSLALGVGALVAATVVEQRVAEPLIDLGLFRNRVFASALVSLTFSMLAAFSISFLLPFYFEELRGFSTARSGLLLTPLALTQAVISPTAGAAADRLGSRWLAPLGLAVLSGGLLLLAQLDTTSSTWDVTWRLVVAGIGQGLFFSPNTRALMDAAPATEQGQASGLLATGRVAGQALSVALTGAIFASMGGAAAGSALIAQGVRPGRLSHMQTSVLDAKFLDGFHAALMMCAAFAAAGALVALVRGKEQERVPVAARDGQRPHPTA